MLSEIADIANVLFPVHPCTRNVMKEIERLLLSPRLRFIDPVGYLEFLVLQRKAALVIMDSGCIQEETTYLGIPCLTVRENTERPINMDVGSNILVRRDIPMLRREADKALSGKGKSSSTPPLWDGMASERIAAILLDKA